jgi:hypothetical protein
MPSQSGKKFNILFCGDVREDIISLGEYIEDFYKRAGAPAFVDLNVSKLYGVVSSMISDFPSHLTAEQASPFKKVASFTTFFSAERPILTPLPADVFGDFATHQNAIIAFSLSVDALFGAQIQREDKGVTLENRIFVSDHFWQETILSISNCAPIHHFGCVALLYEALAYQFNPDASYERRI